MPINICVMISDRRLTRHKHIETEEECDRRQKRSCRICGMGPRKAKAPDRAGMRRGPESQGFRKRRRLTGPACEGAREARALEIGGE